MARNLAGICWWAACVFRAALLLLCFAQRVQAQEAVLVFTGPSGPVVAGTRTNVWLNVLNQSGRQLSWTFPKTIDCQIVSPPHAVFKTTLELQPGAESGEVAIAPGGFARGEYLLAVPAALTGQGVVEFPGLAANSLALEVRSTPPPGKETERKFGFARALKLAEPAEEGREFNPGRFFKEHISGYNPFYFIAGTESPNAKFQISFKYQLLNNEGYLAQKAPALKGLHVAYTQTSLWDWNKPSAPFLDSSYKPELLYAWDRMVGGQPTNWFRLDLQTGVQHESNGRDGAASRSLNLVYLRPTATFGRPDRLQFILQPRVFFYAGGLSDNPDLPFFRGYSDLRAIVGWTRGLQVSAIGRVGSSWDRGSVQIDLTYPMMSLFSRSFSLYLDAQYFVGYGESLLLYNQHSSAFRIGFALYR